MPSSTEGCVTSERCAAAVRRAMASEFQRLQDLITNLLYILSDNFAVLSTAPPHRHAHVSILDARTDGVMLCLKCHRLGRSQFTSGEPGLQHSNMHIGSSVGPQVLASMCSGAAASNQKRTPSHHVLLQPRCTTAGSAAFRTQPR